MLTYTIIIPTLNEEKYIGRCLQAIRDGIEQPDEVLVVDGNSIDRTRDIAEAMGAQVYLNPHIHAAGGRNIGIARACGEVIVFTDADCVPCPSWLAEIKHVFDGDACVDGVGGPMLALPPRSKVEAFWARTFLEEIMPFPKVPLVIEQRVFRGAFMTANCAYKNQLLAQLGGFDEWFGNHAEDVDLFWRAINHRAQLLFWPAAITYHSFPSTIGGMLRKNFRNGVSSSRLQKRYGRCVNFDGLLYRRLGGNVLNAIRRQEDALYGCFQISAHLAGKYYGSMKFGVINV